MTDQLTERLRWWRILAPTFERRSERTLYVAVLRCVDGGPDWPGIVVSACVFTVDVLGVRHVDWIETAEPMRRRGYAGELLRAIEADGELPLQVTGVTKTGRALERAWTKSTIIQG